MDLFNSFDRQTATKVGFGVRTLLISDAPNSGVLSHKLAGLGCSVEVIEDVYSALDCVVDGPDVFQLVVIDCDCSGGLDLGRRAHNLLRTTGRCIPVMLISGEIAVQKFPQSRYEPTILRAPSSLVSLRVGFEHALQERLLYAQAS